MLLKIYTIWEMNVLIYIKWGPTFLNWWIIPFKIINLQTKIYLAFFSDFEYLAPLQSYKILIRVSSEKTYCCFLSIASEPWYILGYHPIMQNVTKVKKCICLNDLATYASKLLQLQLQRCQSNPIQCNHQILLLSTMVPRCSGLFHDWFHSVGWLFVQ